MGVRRFGVPTFSNCEHPSAKACNNPFPPTHPHLHPPPPHTHTHQPTLTPTHTHKYARACVCVCAHTHRAGSDGAKACQEAGEGLTRPYREGLTEFRQQAGILQGLFNVVDTAQRLFPQRLSELSGLSNGADQPSFRPKLGLGLQSLYLSSSSSGKRSGSATALGAGGRGQTHTHTHTHTHTALRETWT